MSLFGNSSVFGTNTAATTGFGTAAAGSGLSNPNKDYEIANPSDDSISSLAFSPATIQQNFLVSGAWDNNVRCWTCFHINSVDCFKKKEIGYPHMQCSMKVLGD